VLHRVSEEELARVTGPNIAMLIAKARTGNLSVLAGGAGTYGRIVQE
jgi:PHP family Zn ribbon phosphoesterase